MDNDTIKIETSLTDLSRYRFEQAARCLKSARLLASDGDYKGGANRSYYAIFHAMRSVLAMDNKDFARHSGVSAYFRKTYIKTGIFDTKMSDYIREAFDVRDESDYDDFYIVSKEEVHEQIANADVFLQTVGVYLKQRWSEQTAE